MTDPSGGVWMALQDLGNIGGFAGAAVVLIFLIYPALQNLNGRPVGSRLEESS